MRSFSSTHKPFSSKTLSLSLFSLPLLHQIIIRSLCPRRLGPHLGVHHHAQPQASRRPRGQEPARDLLAVPDALRVGHGVARRGFPTLAVRYRATSDAEAGAGVRQVREQAEKRRNNSLLLPTSSFFLFLSRALTLSFSRRSLFKPSPFSISSLNNNKKGGGSAGRRL